MRIDNAIRNSLFALISQTITIILKALTQIVFVKTLSVEYLGINGLFSNILTMLSLAELGVGSAILYNMYKPMAEKEIHRVKALMNFYKSTYLKIGITVLLIGFALTPFLNYLIKDTPDIPELEIIYLLYVFNNAVSYFFVYKQSVLIADQKNYVVLKFTIVKNIFMNLLQIIFLILTGAFLPYLIISIVSTIVFNVLISTVADKYYPYLRNNNESLLKEEKKSIYKDVYAMMAHKIGGVIVIGTDNLLISAFVGISAVGLYSNYLLILTCVKGFLNQIYDALVSSIGELINSETKEKIYSIYKNLLFICFWITTLVSLGFYFIANSFIAMAFGREYLFDDNIVLLMTLNFYIADLTGIRSITNKFKTAYGLFWKDRYKPYIESVINITVSILLLKRIEFAGVLLGTLISTMTTGFWIEPYVLYKYGFKKSMKEYWSIYLKNMLICIFSGMIIFAIIKNVENYFVIILVGGCLAILIPSVIIILCYRKTEEYNFFLLIVKKIVRKVKNETHY